MPDQYKHVDGKFVKIKSDSIYDDGPHFDGVTYEAKYDCKRLKSQKDKIFMLMKDGVWRTLGEINNSTGAPEASASACLRDFRKPKFGFHTVERRIRGDRHRGLYEYKLVVNRNTFQE